MGRHTPSLVMSRKMGHFYIIPRKYGAVLFNYNKLHKILGKNRVHRNMPKSYPQVVDNMWAGGYNVSIL